MKLEYTTKEKNFISVIAYVKNNEKEIEIFLRNVDEKLFKNFESYEFIIVNDSSTDQTKENIKKIQIIGSEE